jgi:hypothetical protein
MTIESKFDVYNVAATEDLTASSALFKAVGFGGTIVGSPRLAAGILHSKGLSGQQVSVIYQGIAKVVAGAAITTPGFGLTVTTSGFVIAASSGGSSIGRALTAAASGDLIPAYVDFKQIPAFTLA